MPTKILYAILNWGLGHASRSIPIIKNILAQNIELVLASDGEALLLLQKEFPNLVFETLPAYQIHYSKNAKDFDKTIFLQLPKLTAAIKNEHEQTQKLIEKHQISHIISDNRYGVYSKEIPSVIICHQLSLQHKNKLSQRIMNEVHFKLLNKFQEIWVPDFEGENALAGNISTTENKKIKAKTKYIGALSRFEKIETKILYDICILLSGPEPQRSILEEKLYVQASILNQKIAFVRGISKPENKLKVKSEIAVFNLLETNALNLLLEQSKIVVCRAGYSSVMDLVKLQKPAILIPTPGQTEQEYLAKFLNDKGFFVSKNQEEIDLQKDLAEVEKTNVSHFNFDLKALEKVFLAFF